jgi:virulence-associated protein VapD
MGEDCISQELKKHVNSRNNQGGIYLGSSGFSGMSSTEASMNTLT